MHETTQADDEVIEARISEEFLSAILDLHERDVRMFVTVMDGIEDIFLNSHSFSTLNKRNFSFPVYLLIEILKINIEMEWKGKERR